jgi:hypothetical protein
MAPRVIQSGGGRSSKKSRASKRAGSSVQVRQPVPAAQVAHHPRVQAASRLNVRLLAACAEPSGSLGAGRFGPGLFAAHEPFPVRDRRVLRPLRTLGKQVLLNGPGGGLLRREAGHGEQGGEGDQNQAAVSV